VLLDPAIPAAEVRSPISAVRKLKTSYTASAVQAIKMEDAGTYQDNSPEFLADRCVAPRVHVSSVVSWANRGPPEQVRAALSSLSGRRGRRRLD